MRFKVGDVVLLHYNGAYDGTEGEILEVEENAMLPYLVYFSGNRDWFSEDELELVSGENE